MSTLSWLFFSAFHLRKQCVHHWAACFDMHQTFSRSCFDKEQWTMKLLSFYNLLIFQFHAVLYNTIFYFFCLLRLWVVPLDFSLSHWSSSVFVASLPKCLECLEQMGKSCTRGNLSRWKITFVTYENSPDEACWYKESPPFLLCLYYCRQNHTHCGIQCVITDATAFCNPSLPLIGCLRWLYLCVFSDAADFEL